MKKVKMVMVLSLSLSAVLVTGCTTKKATVEQHGDQSMVVEEEVDVSFEEAAAEVIHGEPDVYTLIENDIKLLSENKEFEKVQMDTYHPDASYYSWFLNKDVYGHVTNGIVKSIIARFDGNHISMREAEEIVIGLLPEYRKRIKTYTEGDYVYNIYSSTQLSGNDVIEVRYGTRGGQVQVVSLDVVADPTEGSY